MKLMPEGPVINIVSVTESQLMTRVPPGSLTLISVSFEARPLSIAATTVAQAPVPQA